MDDIIRRLKRLDESDLEHLSSIVDFMVKKSSKEYTPPVQIPSDLVAVIADQAQDAVDPILVRGKTILKHMNSGHFNNRKIVYLANSIVESAEEVSSILETIFAMATDEREGAKRCTCDIRDLWNGGGCKCGGV